MSLFNYIKSKLSILEVVLQYVQLKQAGGYWKGRCPFHDEKDGSFTVSPDKQIFYCFGCHSGGDVVAFIAKAENVNQMDALWHLIDRYNIAIPKELQGEISVSSDSLKEKSGFYNTCEEVANWCREQLGVSMHAKKYLSARGIAQSEVERFRVGYFPGGMRNINRFVKELARKNVLLKDLLAAGVLIKGRSSVYSPFEERIIFPIYDQLGRACGFGGRVYRDNDERAKYYNSKESAFFLKGHLLFGLDLAKKDMRDKECAFLVEGYTDCVAMSQAGFKNTVATLGTSCTSEHLKLLSRYINVLYVLYDGDAAGQKAILRLVELCWGVNLDLNIIKLLASDDPATFLSNGGDLKTEVERAKDIFTFFVEEQGEAFSKKTLSEKLRLSDKIIRVVAGLSDPFKRDLLLQRAANIMQVPYDSLKELLESTGTVNAGATEEVFPLDAPKEVDGEVVLEKKILFAIIDNVGRAEELSIDRELVERFGKETKFYLGRIRDVLGEEPANRFSVFFGNLDEEQKKMVSFNCLRYGGEVSAGHFNSLLWQFRKQKWREIVADFKFKIVKAQGAGDAKEIESLTTRFLELKREMKAKGIL